MPDGTEFYYTNSRSLGADGEINIEGKGVAPTLRVPMTEEVLFSGRDVLLETAVDYLRGGLSANVPEQGQSAPDAAAQAITIGQTVSGTVTPDAPARYTLTTAAATRLDIVATGEGATERGLVVRVLRPDTLGVLSENYALPGEPTRAGFRALAFPANLTVIIEVASAAPTVSGTYTLTITEVK
jgi:hypothetical protein